MHAARKEGSRPRRCSRRQACKRYPNQAGNTLFLAPDLVEGTLRRGFEMPRAAARRRNRGPVNRTNAFVDANDAEDRGLQLLDPATDEPTIVTSRS